ncbi:MAG: hypothetical protein FWB91_00475 [Defluviitaleaceae bacterium]|nr:hypothetical protein [Defluviitaleaceae bacterium]
MDSAVNERLNVLEGEIANMEHLFFTDGQPFSISKYKEGIDRVKSIDRLNAIDDYSRGRKGASMENYRREQEGEFLPALTQKAEQWLDALQLLQKQNSQEQRIAMMIKRCNNCFDHIKEVRQLIRDAL